MKAKITLREALADDALLGKALPGESWAMWRALLIATMGEPLEREELEMFRQVTGRSKAPPERVEEALYAIGRRGGKDRAAAVLNAYLAGLMDHRDVLAPGERGLLLCIGPDQRQARITRDYTEAVFDKSPVLSSMVVNRTADSIELSNKVAIEVRSASFRRLRGPTAVAIVATEAAFWHTDDSAANADTEILNAARPMLATTGGPLIIITSPYAKRGEVWDTYRRHYGEKGDPLVLVAQAPSRTMNPTLSERVVQRALERDRAAASAEYLAEFRSDLEAYVSLEAVDACVDAGVFERPRVSGVTYFAFTDPSGGSADSMTLAIGHREKGVVVVDCLREIKAPFDPETAVDELSAAMSLYGVKETTGDRYAGQWCAQSFKKRRIAYEPSELPKSALYIDLLPRLNAKTIRLLDVPRAVNQIANLERCVSRGGRDSIDHPPNGRDDIANAIAGLSSIASKESDYDVRKFFPSDPEEREREDFAWRRMIYARQHGLRFF